MQAPISLCFRCDATSDTGMGHFIRCFELAKSYLQSSSQVTIFFVGNYNAIATELLEGEQIPFHTLPSSQLLNPQLVKQLLPQQSILWLDGYAFDQNYLDTLSRLEIPWGCFDDMCDKNFSKALFVVNFCLGKSSKDYRFPPQEMFIGPHYLPIQSVLRPTRLSNLAEKERRIQNILICIGSYDRHTCSPLLASLALQSFPEANLSYFGENPPRNPRIQQLEFSTNFPQILATADLVICGGGRLKYEASYAAIPFATIAQTELEWKDTQNFVSRGLGVDLGKSYELDAHRIKKQFQQIQKQKDWSAFLEASKKYFSTNSNSQLTSQVYRCIENSCVSQ